MQLNRLSTNARSPCERTILVLVFTGFKLKSEIMWKDKECDIDQK